MINGRCDPAEGHGVRFDDDQDGQVTAQAAEIRMRRHQKQMQTGKEERTVFSVTARVEQSQDQQLGRGSQISEALKLSQHVLNVHYKARP
jgi:hypothetical protein